MKVIFLNKTCRVAAAAVITLSGVLTLRAGDPYPDAVLAKSPLAYWRFNETAASPALNRITNSGSLAASADGNVVLDVTKAQTGVVGNCIRLNNPGLTVGFCGSKVDVPWSAALNPNPPFTIEFWAQPSGLGSDTTGFCPLMSFNPFGFGGGNRSGWLFYLANNGKWQFRLGLTSGYAGILTASSGLASANTWQHIVATYDGSTMQIYINGVSQGTLASNQATTGWKPNPLHPLRIGGTGLFGSLGDFPWISGLSTSGNRGWDGFIDEVAIYPSILTASKVAAHYDAAKPTGGATNTAGYATQIAADNPLAYYRFEEPVYSDSTPLPTIANTGSATGADGTNEAGVVAAQAGASYAGFGANNKSAFFNGQGGHVGLQDSANLHFSGNITMMAWVKPNQKDYFRNIVAHGWDGGYEETFLRISMSDPGDGGGTTTNYYEVGVTDGQGPTGAGDYYDAALFPVPNGDVGQDAPVRDPNWVFIAGTYDGTTWSLYRNGVLVGTKTSTHGALDVSNSWSIGSRSGPPSPTRNATGVDYNSVFAANGLFFGGSLDEVAIFNTALIGPDITALYNAAQVPPVITRAVKDPSPVFKGGSASFNVWAEGSPSLSYLWLSNSVSTGITATNASFSNFPVGSHTIAVAVSNPYGSTTSSVTFAVVAAAPSFTVPPASISRFAGRPFTFSATVSGSTPMSFQWKTNGVAIPGATSTSYGGTASSGLNGYSFVLTASNEVTQIDSTPAILTVVPVPSGTAGAVVADGPISFYRLDEASGTVAHDLFNGIDGTYHSVTLGQPGFSAIDPDTAGTFAGTANSYVGQISGTAGTGLNFSGHTNFTLEVWVNGAPGQADESTIIAKGIGANGTTATEQFSLDVASNPNNGGESNYRFFTRGSGTFPSGVVFADVGPDATWHHIVCVYDDLNALGLGTNMHIFVNGDLRDSKATRGGPGVRTSSDPVSIGSKRTGNDPNYNGSFAGTIDEVALYNYALSLAQISNHYALAYGTSLKPSITKQPTPETVYENFQARFDVGAIGTQPLTYQWSKQGFGPLSDGGNITGASTRKLVIDPASPADAGTYSVSINNSVGPVTNSSTASLTVIKAPTNTVNVPGLVLHMTFNGSLNDSSGRGNNGTGMHVATNLNLAGSGVTNAASPSGGNPDFNYVSDGVIGQGLHYATRTDAADETFLQSDTGGSFTNSYYVTLGNKPDLNFSSNVNFSVAFWIRFPVFNGQNDLGDLPFFCSAPTSYGGQGFTFAPSYNQRPTVAQGGGSWSYSLNGNVQLYGPQYVLDDGLWHHVAHSFDRTGFASSYIDGRQVDVRADAAAGDLYHTNTVSIGQDPTGSYGESGAYDIDDLGVWRRAITPLEVASLYLAANPNGAAHYSFVDITPTMTRGPAANQITITWQAGTLQQTATLGGAWADVPGTVAGPSSLVVTLPDPTKGPYFRTRWFQ